MVAEKWSEGTIVIVIRSSLAGVSSFTVCAPRISSTLVEQASPTRGVGVCDSALPVSYSWQLGQMML